MTDFVAARRNMVDCQLRPNTITDAAILGAVGTLAREAFLPEAIKPVAYVDEDLPLKGGRHVMEPLVLCKLLQAGAPQATDKALDVGCNVGYSTALLAKLVAQATGIESDARLVDAAIATTKALGIANVKFHARPIRAGLPEQAPYNLILLSGAVSEVPKALFDQLAEGGRLVGVVGSGKGGRGMLYRKVAGNVSGRPLFDAATPVLAELEPAQAFQF